MALKKNISVLLINPKLVRWLLRFIPHRFIIRFYSSSLMEHSVLPADSIFSIVSGYGRGIQMALRIADKSNVHETYYWLGFVELAVQRLFAKFIKKGFVVYDIGAYIGFHSLLAGRLAGPSGKIYAFELSPLNIGRLKLNISLNGMQDSVFCIPKAVTDITSKSLCRNSGRDDWNKLVDGSYLDEISYHVHISKETTKAIS